MSGAYGGVIGLLRWFIVGACADKRLHEHILRACLTASEYDLHQYLRQIAKQEISC
jgi:hypothetical protein